MEIIYRADDGKEFDNEKDCRFYEEYEKALGIFITKFQEMDLTKNTGYTKGYVYHDMKNHYIYYSTLASLFKEACYPILRIYAENNAVESCQTVIGLLDDCFSEFRPSFGTMFEIFVRNCEGNLTEISNW